MELMIFNRRFTADGWSAKIGPAEAGIRVHIFCHL